MGFKRRRDNHYNQHNDYQQRLTPAEEALNKSRRSLAHIGEPSQTDRGDLFQSVLKNLEKVPEKSYSLLAETIRAVIYEQPHKIGYLSHILTAVQEDLTFYVIEMAQDELEQALARNDWARVRVFVRFLSAMHPVVANMDVILNAYGDLLDKAATLAQAVESVNVAVSLYKTVLLASIYIPSNLVNAELREKFLSVKFDVVPPSEFEYFRGDGKPYAAQYEGALLLESAKNLNENGWNANILAQNPLLLEDESKMEVEAKNAQNEGKITTEEVTNIADVNGEEAVKAVTTQSEDPKAESTKAGSDENVDADVKMADIDPAGAGSDFIPLAPEPEKQVTKYTLRSINVPETVQNVPPVAEAQDLYFRCYMPIDGIETVPKESNVAGHLLRDVAIDNMKHMDFNRREVVRQLIVLDEFFARGAFTPPGTWLDKVLEEAKEDSSKPTWKVEDVALEAIFSQLFDLTKPAAVSLPNVYYHSLLVEACVMAPQDVAPVLGRGLRFMFNNLSTADAEILFRVVDWFAHHVSNFAFTWKWNEWTHVLAYPSDHPQQVFIRELLSKQVRLSYAQRVRDVIPEEFRELVPIAPDVPELKYEGNPLASQLIEILVSGDDGTKHVQAEKKRKRPDDDSYDPEPGAEEESVKGEAGRHDDESPSEARSILLKADNSDDMLVTVILHLGNRSVTHAKTWISRTLPLLREFVTNNAQLIDSIFDYWKQSPWVGALVAQNFVNAGFATLDDLVSYVIGRPKLLLSSVGWEIMSVDASTALKALQGIELEGDYGKWWKERLLTAFTRIARQDSWTAETLKREASRANLGLDTASEVALSSTKPREDQEPSMESHGESAGEAPDSEVASAPKRQKK